MYNRNKWILIVISILYAGVAVTMAVACFLSVPNAKWTPQCLVTDVPPIYGSYWYVRYIYLWMRCGILNRPKDYISFIWDFALLFDSLQVLHQFTKSWSIFNLVLPHAWRHMGLCYDVRLVVSCRAMESPVLTCTWTAIMLINLLMYHYIHSPLAGLCFV